MINQLKEDHDRMRGLMAALLALFDADGPPAVEQVMQVRMQISSLFRTHFGRERQAIEVLRNGGRGSAVDAVIGEYDRVHQLLFLNYSQIIRQWTPQQIREGWTAYCEASRDQMRNYIAFLDWKERALFPLLTARAACTQD